MDSFLQPTTSAPSNNGANAMVALSEREKFLSTYVRDQPWSLPDSIIYYISKNPSNSNVYQKMIQSCKYFFVQNRLLVVKNLNFEYKKSEWHISFNGKEVDLNCVSRKLWITDQLLIINDTPISPNSLTTLLSKIYQCDAKILYVIKLKIYITDLQFLASKCEKTELDAITVINADGSVVGLEKIVEVFPKIEGFHFTLGASQNVITSETVQKVIQLPYFSNLEYFYLTKIPEIFDIDTFYDYIKKNKKTKIYLKFVHQLSQEYQNRLQTIVNEIIAAQNHDFNVPLIYFSGIDFSSFYILFELFKRN